MSTEIIIDPARDTLYETSIDISDALLWLTGSLESASKRIEMATACLRRHQLERAAQNVETDRLHKIASEVIAG